MPLAKLVETNQMEEQKRNRFRLSVPTVHLISQMTSLHFISQLVLLAYAKFRQRSFQGEQIAVPGALIGCRRH